MPVEFELLEDFHNVKSVKFISSKKTAFLQTLLTRETRVTGIDSFIGTGDFNASGDEVDAEFDKPRVCGKIKGPLNEISLYCRTPLVVTKDSRKR